MPIYVDSLMCCVPTADWRWHASCHRYADAPSGLAELHLFAHKLGLRQAWFQGAGSVPHYDLTPARRRRALKMGAIFDEDHRVLQKLLRAARVKKIPR